MKNSELLRNADSQVTESHNEIQALESDPERAWRETGSKLVGRQQNFSVPACPHCGQSWPEPGKQTATHAGASNDAKAAPVCEVCLQPFAG